MARADLPRPTEDELIARYFAPPDLETLPAVSEAYEASKRIDPALARFAKRNVHPHKVPGYGIVTISLKPIGAPPGDATSEQMDAIADIAERYSADELRVSHEQNLVLPHVKLDDIPVVFAQLQKIGLGIANAGFVTDIIACPGLDFCSLANARSIPVAISSSSA